MQNKDKIIEIHYTRNGKDISYFRNVAQQCNKRKYTKDPSKQYITEKGNLRYVSAKLSGERNRYKYQSDFDSTRLMHNGYDLFGPHPKKFNKVVKYAKIAKFGYQNGEKNYLWNCIISQKEYDKLYPNGQTMPKLDRNHYGDPIYEVSECDKRYVKVKRKYADKELIKQNKLLKQ